MNFFQKRARLKNANYLELRPIRLVPEEITNNHVAILMPKFTSKFAKKYILPKLKTPHIKLKLDELSATTWLAIDGKKTVKEIAKELLQKFSGQAQPVERRLTTFLTLLYEQKLLTFTEIQ